MKKIQIFTDGSCLGNPGFGGYCAIVKYKDHEKIVKGANKDTTNNQMELSAVIEGLRALKEPCEVSVTSDSTYVVKGVNEWLINWVKKDFKKIKNKELWLEYIKVSKSHKVQLSWVKAHNGHAENEQCDEVARNEATLLQQKAG